MMLEETPKILLITREPLKPGCEAAYSAIEEETARNSVQLNCPHPYLALEPLTGPKEVWWLNTFDSEEHLRQVEADYANNQALMQVLNRNSKRKESLTEPPVFLYVTYRADLSESSKWTPAGARFMVVVVTKKNLQTNGSVFESSDGIRYILIKMRERGQAESAAATFGNEARIFAVRPNWSMPATEWIDADPDFWNEKLR
jgi:hypothetical protein